MPDGRPFSKELCLLLNILVIIINAIISKSNLFLTTIGGFVFFILCAHSLVSRAENKTNMVLYSILSPFVFTASYIWFTYLFDKCSNYLIRLEHSYKYYIMICILLDIIYCKMFPEKVNSKENLSDKYKSSFNCDVRNSSIGNFEKTIYVNSDALDAYFEEAGKYVIEKNIASVGMLQRLFKIGFNRASRIMDQLCDAGVVGPEEGTKPRRVLMSADEFEYLIENGLILSKGESSDTGINDSSRIELYNGNFDYMNGIDFECYCADLLRKNGFNSVTVTPSSGDYGADIIAEQNGVRYAIQCKCYSSDIGVDAVYQVSGGMKYYKANVGVVLTNRYFTRQAKELANSIGVILWDRDFLVKLIGDFN